MRNGMSSVRVRSTPKAKAIVDNFLIEFNRNCKFQNVIKRLFHELSRVTDRYCVLAKTTSQSPTCQVRKTIANKTNVQNPQVQFVIRFFTKSIHCKRRANVKQPVCTVVKPDKWARILNFLASRL